MMLIGICGASGSGKSTLASLLAERLGERVLLLPQDHYYRDRTELSFEERTHLNYDDPKAFEHDELLGDIKRLAAGLPIVEKGYDYTRHCRKDTGSIIEPREAVIVDGIHMFYDGRLREMMDLRIYMEVPADVCVLRRVRRDLVERGRSLDSINSQYLETVRPMYEKYIRSYADYADIMVGQDARNDRLCDMLSAYILACLDAKEQK